MPAEKTAGRYVTDQTLGRNRMRKESAYLDLDKSYSLAARCQTKVRDFLTSSSVLWRSQREEPQLHIGFRTSDGRGEFEVVGNQSNYTASNLKGWSFNLT